MARPQKGEARAAILDAAERLFYKNGVRAVGVDLVAEEAGITKRTLYYHFPNKEALIAGYLTRYDEMRRGPLAERAERFGQTPGDHVLGLFDAFAQQFDQPDYRGCAFLNAIVESDEAASSVRGCVSHHKDSVRDWIENKLNEAQAQNAPDLAEQMMLLLDGALIRVLVYPGSRVMRQAQSAAAALLQNAGVSLSNR